MTTSDLILTFLLALMALLYASVGHAGSSGYQAAMALMGVEAGVMKTTALSLNIVVAAIAWFQFARRGWFDWRLWALLCCASAPAALVGGMVELPKGWYYLLVAVVLWLAAVRLWQQPRRETPEYATRRRPSLPLILVLGGVLGFLSGLTGTGGGIFLTPVLVLTGWCMPRQAAGVSAAFILVNSAFALKGWWDKSPAFPALLPVWLVVVAVCGWLGAWYGSRFGSPVALRRLLAVVLVIAGVKMVLELWWQPS